MALTLADIWNIATDGKAVIIGQGGAIRATAGLVGRGACLVNGRKVIAASYSTRDAGWETNPTCYTMSGRAEALQRQRGLEGRRRYVDGPRHLRRREVSRVEPVPEASKPKRCWRSWPQAAIGADDVTDLVMVNMKGPDYTAHAHGPASAEQQ